MDVTFHETKSFFKPSSVQGDNIINEPLTQILELITPDKSQTEPTQANPQIYPEHTILPFERVYTRRGPLQLEDSQEHTHDQSTNNTPTLPDSLNHTQGTPIPDSPNTDMPIALRKGVRSCTQHPIK